MVTMHNTSSLNTDALQLRGLSTDTKPIETWVDVSVKPNISRKVGNASSYKEIDTGKRFLYDEVNKKWYEDTSGGGGGGDDPSNTASPEDIQGIIDDIWGD